MAITPVTNHLVFPTENDVHGGSSGAGRIGQETTLAALWKGLGCTNCVVSGFTPIATGAGFDKAVPAGEAVIDGYVVKGTNSTTFTFTASETANLFLRLNFTSSKVTSVTLESYTGTTVPANSVLLARVVTDGSGVTSYTDRRPQNRRIYGKCSSTGTILESGSGRWSASGGAGTVTITLESGFFFRTPCVNVTAVTIDLAGTAEATSTTSITVDTQSASDFYFEAWL